MAATGIFLRRANKNDLIVDPPLIGEIVFALDSQEYGALLNGVLVWRNIFDPDLTVFINDVISQLIDDSTTSLNKTYSSQKIQNLHNIQAEAIANLATSQARIINSSTPVFNISTTEQQLPFIIATNSTDESIFTIDDANNTITFLKNATFNFISTIIIGSQTTQPRIITFNLRNTFDNSILTSISAGFDLANNVTETFTLNTLLTIGKNGLPSAPVTMKIGVVANQTGYHFDGFSSILASSNVYDINVLDASSINFSPVMGIDSTNVQSAIEELNTKKAPILSPNFIGTPRIDSRGNVLTDEDFLNGGYF